MTVDAATPYQTHTVAGIGPYAASWPYVEGAVRVSVRGTDGVPVALASPADWSVSPTSSTAAGNVTLTPAAAAAHVGKTLIIERVTPDEQGWVGNRSALDKGIEGELDTATMALQELRALARRSLRATLEMPPFTPGASGTTLIWTGAGFTVGPSADAIAGAQAAAIEAQAAAALAVLNGGTAFASRAAAMAATISAPIMSFCYLHAGVLLCVRRDPAGTALTTNGGTVNWAPASAMPSPKDYGAWGDGIADDLAAFTAWAAAMVPWGAYEVTPGTYALSGTAVIKNRYRSKIFFRGVLVPRGSFSDYLVHFDNDAGDPLVLSMGQQALVQGLTLDCQWKSRGVKIEKAYNSAFDDMTIWRPFGTGIYTPMVQEVSMKRPQILYGKPRIDATVQAAGAYNGATTYSAGTIVQRTFPVWNVGTAYAAGAFVQAGGFLHRALLASTGVDPALAANAATWERIPEEYFQSMGLAGNTGRDPLGATDYTTRAVTTGDRHWRPRYLDEAAWEIVGNGPSVTIDNLKVSDFVCRACAHNTILRVDNPENSTRPTLIEFSNPQFHAISQAYIAAFNADAPSVAAYGGTITPPQQGKLVHLVSASQFRLRGGQMQCGDLAWCKALICGTLGISGNAASTTIDSMSINGTAGGTAQVGISILPSVETVGAKWAQSGVIITMSGTYSADKVDPGGETEFLQTGNVLLLGGQTSVAVTFPRPFAAIPSVDVLPKGPLGGLNWHATNISTTGFTLTVDGDFTGPLQATAFTAAGPANQTGTYTHNLIQADTYKLYGASADGGANFRVNLNSNSPSAISIVAPVAPAVNLTQSWAAVWIDRCPSAVQFGWTAQVETDL